MIFWLSAKIVSDINLFKFLFRQLRISVLDLQAVFKSVFALRNSEIDEENENF